MFVIWLKYHWGSSLECYKQSVNNDSANGLVITWTDSDLIQWGRYVSLGPKELTYVDVYSHKLGWVGLI